MKKINNSGFMLAETLIVTVFVSGILIYLYIQFSNLNKSYEDSYIYNTVETLYALDDIKIYIEREDQILEYINTNIEDLKYIDITDCSLFTEVDYCKKLFEVENIKSIFITTNQVPDESIIQYNEEFTTFIKKINKEGNQSYRIVAEFNNYTYATLRFGG